MAKHKIQRRVADMAAAAILGLAVIIPLLLPTGRTQARFDSDQTVNPEKATLSEQNTGSTGNTNSTDSTDRTGQDRTGQYRQYRYKAGGTGSSGSSGEGEAGGRAVGCGNPCGQPDHRPCDGSD